jgi:hypothetical protein
VRTLESKHVGNYVLMNYICVLCLTELSIYYIAKHDGMPPINPLDDKFAPYGACRRGTG